MFELCHFVEEYERRKAACRIEARSARSQSLEEPGLGSREFSAGVVADTSRSLSYPNDDDTSAKTYATASDDQQNDRQHHGSVSGVMEQNVPPVSSSDFAVMHDEPCSNTLSQVECVGTEDTDGPEPDISSTPAAVSLPTSANESGCVEQDGALSPLSRSVRSMRLGGSGSVSTQRRPAENHNSPVTLWNYQKELAEPGCQGSNCIICAPTGSGKTFTAGFICKSRRDSAIKQNKRFKCLFVVCIRNLIIQQQDALRRIMPDNGIVCGVDDKLLLSEYFHSFDVVVATAQVCVSQE